MAIQELADQNRALNIQEAQLGLRLSQERALTHLQETTLGAVHDVLTHYFNVLAGQTIVEEIPSTRSKDELAMEREAQLDVLQSIISRDRTNQPLLSAHPYYNSSDVVDGVELFINIAPPTPRRDGTKYSQSLGFRIANDGEIYESIGNLWGNIRRPIRRSINLKTMEEKAEEYVETRYVRDADRELVTTTVVILGEVVVIPDGRTYAESPDERFLSRLLYKLEDAYGFRLGARQTVHDVSHAMSNLPTLLKEFKSTE